MATKTFLRNWGVRHRVSSIAFPHSNCRTEVGVKTVKRMLVSNTAENGNLDTDSFQRAMLQYRNTPNQVTKLSPAMCLYGRPIRDFIPILPGKYSLHPTWQSILHDRENALQHRHMTVAENLARHTRYLPSLRVGDYVRIQNQIGLHPRRWDNTGSVIEVRQHNQYVVCVDGSGRVTLRNRKFLRKFTPVRPIQPFNYILDSQKLPTTATRRPEATINIAPDNDSNNPNENIHHNLQSTQPPDKPHTIKEREDQPATTAQPHPVCVGPTPAEILPAHPSPQPLRRSTRDRHQPVRFNDFVLE